MNAERSRGGALIEFALTLPILLTVLLGIVDLSRAIQFDNVLVHMTREGANLAARTTVDKGDIINVLSRTAEPLEMGTDGMIYISKIVGAAGGRGRIEEQYRSGTGQMSLNSELWQCPAWKADSSCQMPGTLPTVALPAPLRADEIIYAVEARYDYQLLTRYLFNAGPDLYAITIL